MPLTRNSLHANFDLSPQKSGERLRSPRLPLRNAGTLVPRVVAAKAEIAHAVAMAIGNSTMTGQAIVLNGGMTFI